MLSEWVERAVSISETVEVCLAMVMAMASRAELIGARAMFKDAVSSAVVLFPKFFQFDDIQSEGGRP